MKNSYQQRTFDSLVRSDSFVDKNGVVLGIIATSAPKLDLEAAIAEARDFDTNHGVATRTLVRGMGEQAALINDLIHSHLRPIAKFARGKLRGMPGYVELTAIASPETPKKLVGLARSIAGVAAKYADKFTEAGLASDTVQRLTAATDALERVLNERGDSRAERKAASKKLDAVLARGRDAVMVLDSAIMQVLKSDDPLLVTWKTESRIEDKTGKPRQKKDTASTTSAAPETAHPTTVTATANPAPAALPASTTQKAA